MSATASASKPKKRLPTDLDRSDWIKAAFRALTSHGPSGVKVDRIAKALGISRGSFYWHFKSVAELKSAMIETWEGELTEDVLADVHQTSDDPYQQLLRLGLLTLDGEGKDYGGLETEAAMRGWARHDEDVAAAVTKVTRIRIENLVGIFGRMGFDDEAARHRAVLLYSAFTGLKSLETVGIASMPTGLAELLRILHNERRGPEA